MRASLALSLLRFRLNRIYFFVQLVVNIVLPVAFVFVIAQSQSPEVVPRLVLSAFIVGGAFSVFRLPAMILPMERLFATRELLATTHINRPGYLLSNAMDGIYYALFPVIGLALSARMMNVSLPMTVSFCGMLGLYLLSLHGGATWLACWKTSLPNIGLMVNMVSMASIALAPIYYPLSNVPTFFQPVIEWWLPSLAMEIGSEILAGEEFKSMHMVGLGAWAVALTGLGHFFFPWTDTSGE